MRAPSFPELRASFQVSHLRCERRLFLRKRAWASLSALALVLAACGEAEPAPAPVEDRPAETPEAAEAVETPREDEAAAQNEREGPVAPVEEAVAISDVNCDHPFVPTRVGQWRTYRWRETGEDRAARLRLVATRIRPVAGEQELRWRATITADDDRSELGTAEIDVRCNASGAEEPWFGVIERSLGLRPTRDGRRWRWPVDLAAGERFEGEATFDPSQAEMEEPEGVSGPQLVRVQRSYAVEDRESITTEAGRFDAWRVRFTERHAFGDRGETGNGVVWVASGAGMVRARSMNSRGIEQTWELIALGDR